VRSCAFMLSQGSSTVFRLSDDVEQINLEGKVKVKDIWGSTEAFAALREDGTVFTWGRSGCVVGSDWLIVC